MKKNGKYWLMFLVGTALASAAFLVPGCGPLLLVAFVPLLAAERVWTQEGKKHFWLFHYGFFLAWNFGRNQISFSLRGWSG